MYSRTTHQKPPAEQIRWEHAKKKKQDYPCKWKHRWGNLRSEFIKVWLRAADWKLEWQCAYVFLVGFWNATREWDCRWNQQHLFFIDRDCSCPPPGRGILYMCCARDVAMQLLYISKSCNFLHWRRNMLQQSKNTPLLEKTNINADEIQ